MGRKLDESRVVWVSPEVIGQQRRAEIVKRHRGDADALIEKLDDAERRLTGEYRVVASGDAPDGDESVGSATRLEGGMAKVAVLEYEDSLAVWIDDAPDDGQDPAGHYELYDPKQHGEPYAPIPSRRGMAAVEAPRVEEE